MKSPIFKYLMPQGISNIICKSSLSFLLSIPFVVIICMLISNSFAVATNLSPPNQLESQNLSTTEHRQALNYLLFSSSSSKQQPQAYDSKLDRLLKDSNHSHVSDEIDLQFANNVWKKMRQNALEFAKQRADEARPTINMLLEQANISTNCRQAINGAIDRLAKLDQWAMQSKYPNEEKEIDNFKLLLSDDIVINFVKSLFIFSV